MQREIKFRAWEENTKKMIEDVHYDKELAHDINPWIFMQFIGLYDKNRKEIYEGDIVNVFAESPDLDANDELAYTIQIEDIRDLPVGLSNCEVIGNIYENPELVAPNQ
jgi:hypothetical protein